MRVERHGRDEIGFSRTDLAVVVFIIVSMVLLASLFLPTLPVQRAKLNCNLQLQMIAQNCQYYANTNDGKLLRADASNLTNAVPSIEQFCQAIGPRLRVSLLVCPQDTRKPASDWKSLNRTNISYFFNPDAGFNDPLSILAGDRNISVSAQGVYTWNPALGLHGDHGNVAFADGHVEYALKVDSARLDQFFHQGGNPTNRLLLP
jgi:prepilin-type processing-associated H-X9-DG protein